MSNGSIWKIIEKWLNYKLFAYKIVYSETPQLCNEN